MHCDKTILPWLGKCFGLVSICFEMFSVNLSLDREKIDCCRLILETSLAVQEIARHGKARKSDAHKANYLYSILKIHSNSLLMPTADALIVGSAICKAAESEAAKHCEASSIFQHCKTRK